MVRSNNSASVTQHAISLACITAGFSTGYADQENIRSFIPGIQVVMRSNGDIEVSDEIDSQFADDEQEWEEIANESLTTEEIDLVADYLRTSGQASA